MRKKILQILDSRAPVSGEFLAKTLDISRQALHKHIRILRSEGYRINAARRTGYRLTGAPDVLTPERVLPRLQTKRFGRSLFHFSKIRSTQDEAKKMAEGGSKEGVLVAAETQSHGRGRLGRSWTSGEGGIWTSLLLRPSLEPSQVPLLALSASVAIAEALEKTCGVSCRVKWPNDVLAKTGKSWKKIAGILTEMSAEADRVHWVVLGIGINANNRIPLFLKDRASSLAEILGKPADRARILCAVLKNLEIFYDGMLKNGFEPVRKTYMRKSVLKKGQAVSITDFKSQTRGRFLNIDPDGSLVIQTNAGQERFWAGEVSFNGKAL